MKHYKTPVIQVIETGLQLPVAQSNVFNDSGVVINPGTMDEGDGGDGVKSNPFTAGDDWSW